MASALLMESINKEYELPLSDSTLAGLLNFQFNFDQLKQVIEFLVQN